MRLPILVALFTALAYASVHKARIEPLEIYDIKAAAAGKVVYSDVQSEGREVYKRLIVKLDTFEEEQELKSAKKRLENLKRILTVNEKSLENLRDLYEIKLDNYEKIKNLKTKSKFEKDVRLSDYLAAYNQYLNQQEKIESLKNQILDLKKGIELLKDKIAKKRIVVSGYVYKIYLKKGDFAPIGARLAQVADISKGKVVVYLGSDEIENLDKKSIYIDGKKVAGGFSKIYKISDPVHISSYRAEIIVPAPKRFSKIVTVEIK